MPVKSTAIDFSDLSGGKNSAFPRHALNKDQCADTLNLVHEKIGVSRAPGYVGLYSSAMFASPIVGHFKYLHANGTETLIDVSGNKIYSIALDTGLKTELGSIAGDGQCYAVNMAGKLWIVNGTSFVKIEDNLAVYKVQISAPTTGAAAKKAGGSLAVGVYGVYVVYVRKNSDGQYLYSLPYSLGNVTLSAGDLTVAVSGVAASTDTQVTHKVVFMTDADGAVVYYYGEIANATTAIDITNTANRSGSIRMDIVSAPNQILPVAPDGIASFGDKLFVWKTGTRSVYWSLKTDVNPFDMERFLAQNFRTFSCSVSSVFPVGVNLFVNSIGNGVYKIPSGDMSAIVTRVQKNSWFKDLIVEEGRTNVVFYKGIAWGLSNDGVRYFDGLQFSDDLSFHIKPDIDAIIAGSGSGFTPSAVVFRRAGKRTELRISFRDTLVSNFMNNSQRIFNLDFYFDPVEPKKTWEAWENGFSAFAIMGGALFGAQSVGSGGTVAKENGVTDIACYDNSGVFTAIEKTKRIYGLSRTHIDRLDAITIWGPIYTLATASGNLYGNLIIFDRSNTKIPFEIIGQPANLAILSSDGSGLGLPLPIVLTGQFPIAATQSMPYCAQGNSVAIEFEQDANDPYFFIYSIQLPKVKEIINNIT